MKKKTTVNSVNRQKLMKIMEDIAAEKPQAVGAYAYNSMRIRITIRSEKK